MESPARPEPVAVNTSFTVGATEESQVSDYNQHPMQIDPFMGSPIQDNDVEMLWVSQCHQPTLMEQNRSTQNFIDLTMHD